MNPLVRLIIMGFSALSLVQFAQADATPIVTVTLQPEQVHVGEPARMRVKVLVPTWFRGAPQYPAFELPNLVTRLPPDSSYPVSERVGRETWSGIVREYRLYPLLGADYLIGGQSMQVSWADPETTQPVSATVALPEVVLRAMVPEGAETLDPYIAGSAFTLERRIEGDTSGLKEGDALVVRYQEQLSGLSALFLPPLAPKLTLNGVSVYADQAVIEEGEPARRSEKVTLVFTAGGEVMLPGRTLQWWNSQTGLIEDAVIEPLTFSVLGKPPSLKTRLDEAGINWRSLLIGAGLICLLLFQLIRWLPPLTKWAQARVDAWRHSEVYAFRALRALIQQRNARAVHHGILTWLNKLEPGIEARRFARDYGDARLATNVNELIAEVYSGTEGVTLDFDGLYSGVTGARGAFFKRRASSARLSLPLLNP